MISIESKFLDMIFAEEDCHSTSLLELERLLNGVINHELREAADLVIWMSADEVLSLNKNEQIYELVV